MYRPGLNARGNSTSGKATRGANTVAAIDKSSGRSSGNGRETDSIFRGVEPHAARANTRIIRKGFINVFIHAQSSPNSADPGLAMWLSATSILPLSSPLMKASVRWLNRLLEPGNLSAEEVESFLTHSGFPIDAREPAAGGDMCLEVEVTSNRGDCLCHMGQAREIAARTGRALKTPTPPTPPTAGPITDALHLQNQVPDACPRFTARVIRGVTIRPSPAWLTEALESVGQRSINNVVDVTNYINFLYGQPTHAFDLDKLAGRTLIVRYARDGETLTTLDGKQRKLKADEVVVADEQHATSLAGVMGGAGSEVSASTRDVVLEAATWDPVAVRRAARRHQLRTDASHRFERGVDPRTIDEPAALAAALIADLGGGRLCTGSQDAGRPAQPLRTIQLRTSRCRALLGVEVADARISEILSALSIKNTLQSAGILACTIPAFRLDLEREVDLIEEVGRVHGLDQVPIHPRMTLSVRPVQNSESAARRIGEVLTGQGFFETVTFSFVTPKHAKPFLPPGLSLLAVSDDRRKGDGTLRPSSLPSLLLCRKSNQDRGATVEGGIRLFESAATYAESAPGKNAERRTLALLLDVPGVDKGKPGTTEQRQHAVRLLRGTIQAAAQAIGGTAVRLELIPKPPTVPAFDAAAHAQIRINNAPVGSLGIIDAATQRLFDLEIPVAAAEIDLQSLIALYPPKTKVHELPAFPSIDRDLSLILDEATSWESVNDLVTQSGVERLEAVSFIGAYRGKQIGMGKKSVTLRMRFRDPARTLRHEEVDPQVGTIVTLAALKLGATLRT